MFIPFYQVSNDNLNQQTTPEPLKLKDSSETSTGKNQLNEKIENIDSKKLAVENNDLNFSLPGTSERNEIDDYEVIQNISCLE